MSSDNTIFPEPDVLNGLEMGKFVLANLAAKRAKQIKEGAPPLVRINSSHPLSIALAEIAAGKIKPIMGSDAEAMEDQDLEAAMEDITVDEMGLLLPGLDEDDDVLSAAVRELGLDDIDDEEEEDSDDDETASEDDGISSLLGDDEEETESAGTDEESESITLDELAEQESASDDDEEPEA